MGDYSHTWSDLRAVSACVTLPRPTVSHYVGMARANPPIEKASRNGAWMPRLCYTQAKATTHAYRARRTIPLFTQLYVVIHFPCVYYHYGTIPSLLLLVSLFLRCACACCVLLRRTSVRLAGVSFTSTYTLRVCMRAWLQTCLTSHP